MLSKRFIGTLCLMLLFSAATSTALFAAPAADLRVVQAAMRGDLAAVRTLVKQKADVNAAQGDGMTALHWAAFKDDLEMVQILVQAGADIKATTRIGAQTPLFVACTTGNAAIIESLLKAGADANSINTADGQTALMRAAASGDAEAVKMLLAHGARVNAKEKAHGQTAVMFAAAENRGAVIKVLAGHGADLKAASTVESLVGRPRYDDDGNLIKEPTPDPKAGNNPLNNVGNKAAAMSMGGMTALLYAARDGQLDAARALVEAGADINQVSESEKTTPLVMALTNAHFDVGKYLLDRGADPNLANIFGLAPLYATIDAQYAPLSWAPVAVTTYETVTHLDMLKALLDRGANPNAKLTRKLWYRPTSHDRNWVRPEGSTAFWRAAAAVDVPAMKLLVQHGADPKIASDEGDTPLIIAAGIGWVPGNFTQTWAEPGAFMSALKYCMELGLDLNARDKNDFTALHGAAWRGDNEMVKFLVEKGARMDIKSKKGWYVTDMANGVEASNGLPLDHPDTVALLVKLGAPAPVAPRAGDAVAAAAKAKEEAAKAAKEKEKKDKN